MKKSKSKIEEYYENMDYGIALEDDSEAIQWLEQHQRKFGHFIDGKFTEPVKGKYFDTRAPATNENLAQIALGTKEDISIAVDTANLALNKWRGLKGIERAKILYALARMVQRHARLFAVLESIDNGKPIRESRDIDIPLVARHFYHHAGWATLHESKFPDHEPIGVIGQIIPWNFPLLMLAWKIAPALALGNTVVLKPAEYTPLTALLFAELAQDCGLPKGVFNLVTGDGTTGTELVKHPGVNKIAFTGSTEVGREIRRITAGSKKSITLELGGKSPFIVFDNADIDSAIEGIVDGIWLNQGQVCCAGSRLLIQESIEKQFIERLKKRMKKLRIGNPLDKSIDLGAIVDEVQLKRIKKYIKIGTNEGVSVFQPKLKLPNQGHFYPPTLICDVHPASTVAIDEIFGPVITAMSFRTPDEAIELANNTRYGLAASIWSESISLALDVAPKLKAGVIWVNSTNLFDAGVGFGGYRESGFGREGGREGALEYLKPKFLSNQTVRKPSKPSPPQNEKNTKAKSIDRTAKLYIGGKQVRPDGNYSKPIYNSNGTFAGEVGQGNRKDIRNAVEVARKATNWSSMSTHNRAQVIYYIGENLAIRIKEFAGRISTLTGSSNLNATKEVETAINKLFFYAAWTDKFDGRVHSPPIHGVALAMNEPIGVVGIVCPPEAPLLSFVSLVAPLIAMGNRTIVVPSENYPLVATDLYQVFETSDVPAGVINIVTGENASLNNILAKHADVDGLWTFGTEIMSEATERLSISNLKQTFVDNGKATDWFTPTTPESDLFLRKSVQVKNIWIPYGE